MNDEGAQFDTLLGGKESLPQAFTVSKFAASRSQEIQIMRKALHSTTGTKLAFQTLPRHMRRRAMSHNVKRLPRRLRQMHFNQMKKSGLPAQQKRPSRKYRRRPKNLMEEYMRRTNKGLKWLQTHIWHAKRFHMIQKWGYKLPYSPCDKAFRACYRALSQFCLLQDISYFKCVEIVGNVDVIKDAFKGITRPDGRLSINAKIFIDGKYEGNVVIYDIDEPYDVLGEILYQWGPNNASGAKLWLWIHVAFYDKIKAVLERCFKNGDLITNQLDNKLCRFRLTGPLSNNILQNVLLPTNFDNQCTQELIAKFSELVSNLTNLKEQCRQWHSAGLNILSNTVHHQVFAVCVQDPRLRIPKKVISKNSQNLETESFDHFNCNTYSPLWDAAFRDHCNGNRDPDIKILDLRKSLLVPGTDLDETDTIIPIILIQRSGEMCNNIDLGRGWDIIVPTLWAKSFWSCFILSGARAGGLREFNSLLFEMGRPQFLQPDTIAGMQEDHENTENKIREFFKKPPNKRTNYNKLRITSPFCCNWNLLIKEWSDLELMHPIIVRDRKVLVAINEYLKGKLQSIPKLPAGQLVPIKLTCTKKGTPRQFALICLPKHKNDFKAVITEPLCEDVKQSQRKQLRRDHHVLLKKMRKERKFKANSYKPELYEDALLKYTKTMRELWLPEPTSIRHSCSREVIGFITIGGFSYSLGKSSATGFIVTDCLQALHEFKGRALFRNSNSRVYYEILTSVLPD